MLGGLNVSYSSGSEMEFLRRGGGTRRYRSGLWEGDLWSIARNQESDNESCQWAELIEFHKLDRYEGNKREEPVLQREGSGKWGHVVYDGRGISGVRCIGVDFISRGMK